MLGKLFKPKWQHKDPKVRKQGLSGLTPESMELIQLAESDPDNDVRLAAITQLEHVPTLIKLGHAAGAVGERARNRVIVLAANQRQHDELLVDVFDWLQNPSLISSIARDNTRGSKLRQQALDKLDDQESLFTIACNDPSKEIQFKAASLLSDLEKLKQLEKKHGRTNKRLRQFLKDKLEQQQRLQQQQTDIETVLQEAKRLGSSNTWAQDKTHSMVLEQRWQKLTQHASDTQQQSFQQTLSEFRQRLVEHEDTERRLQPLRLQQQHILTALQTLQQQLEKNPEQLTVKEIKTQLQTLSSDWEQCEALPADEQAKQEQTWQTLLEKVQHLHTALGNDLQALEKLQQLLAKTHTLRHSSKVIRSKELLKLQSEWTNSPRPQSLRNALGTLEYDFQQNMNNLNSRLEKQEKQKDIVLKELHELLKQLDDHLEHEHYNEAIELHRKLTTKFKEAPDLPSKDHNHFQHRLHSLAPYMREIQDWRRWGTDQARKHLIESAESLRDEDDLDPQERAQKVQTLRDEWRKLAHMDPGQQRTLWKEFNSTVSAAYEPSKQHFAEQARQREVHLDKRQQVCQALEELNQTTDWFNIDWRDQQGKINKLRKQWKNAGTVNHKDWKSINKRFNAAMDDLDEHFKVERNRNWQEREALVEQAQSLLDMSDTHQAIEQAKELQSQWHITVASRHANEQKLWKQFREPIDALFQRLQEERQQKREAHKARIAEEKRLEEEKRQKERERQQRKLDELANLAEASTQRKQQIVDDKQQERHTEQGATLCIQLEILLELETPAAFQQARLEYQISHMSEAMLTRSENTGSEQQQAIKLLKRWYALDAMTADALAQQQPRIQTAFQAIEAQIQA